jgi:hypothetical protein
MKTKRRHPGRAVVAATHDSWKFGRRSVPPFGPDERPAGPAPLSELGQVGPSSCTIGAGT